MAAGTVAASAGELAHNVRSAACKQREIGVGDTDAYLIARLE